MVKKGLFLDLGLKSLTDKLICFQEYHIAGAHCHRGITINYFAYGHSLLGAKNEK